MTKARIYSISFILLILFSSFLVYQTANIQVDKEQANAESDLVRIAYVISAENDTDGDGMPDAWEILHDLDPEYDDSRLDMEFDDLDNLEEYTYNTDPWDPDSDGDGFNDGYEVTKGTDPADPEDHPVRVWLIILIVVLSIGIIILAVWVIRITIKDTKEKGKEKN